MNNVREKLVELLRTAKYDVLGKTLGQTYSDSCLVRIADHLIANSVPVQEWIPVTEPPKKWRRENEEMINYLVYVPEYGVDIGNYAKPAKCWVCMGLPCKPTHWAHLPTPPKQEG